MENLAHGLCGMCRLWPQFIASYNSSSQTAEVSLGRRTRTPRGSQSGRAEQILGPTVGSGLSSAMDMLCGPDPSSARGGAVLRDM